MAYDEKVVRVLREFRLVDAEDNLRNVKIADGGMGPLLSPDVIDRFVAADTTSDKHWLRWIFFQAAGGAKAREASGRGLEQMKQRFVDERVNGFQNPQTSEMYAPVPRAKAEARWTKVEAGFKQLLIAADQDSVVKLGVFGYFRNWPGGTHRIYETVVAAVEKFLRLYKKILQVNKEFVREGKEELPITPEGLDTVEKMVDVTKKVERYIASRTARQDIRLAKWRNEDWIYNDDYVTCVAPLTYAAAVKYGWDSWPWANREKFDQTLSNEHSYGADAWKSNTTRGKVYVYVRFNQPVPRWVARRGGKFEVMQLTNLALELEAGTMKPWNLDNIIVYDEEGRNTMRIEDVKEMIKTEPERPPDPQDEEMPIKRGPNVYKTSQEAQKMLAHFDAALKEVAAWAAKFDLAEIKQDAMSLD
jgi:hypothetical protein